jgi:hypothetical protein
MERGRKKMRLTSRLGWKRSKRQQHVRKKRKSKWRDEAEIPIRSRMKSVGKAGDCNDREVRLDHHHLRMLEVDRPLVVQNPSNPPLAMQGAARMIVVARHGTLVEIVRTVGLVQLEIQIIRVVRPRCQFAEIPPGHQEETMRPNEVSSDDGSLLVIAKHLVEAVGNRPVEAIASRPVEVANAVETTRPSQLPKADATKLLSRLQNAYAPNQ